MNAVKNIRVALLIPYFGKWPSYFNIFLKGCACNPWLEIKFFTDCPVPSDYPAHISFHHFSLQEFSGLASEKLSIPVNITSPYKLCDLKPFYGKIFQDHLHGYHYWGYGDIDLIYGNLEEGIYPRMKQDYDIISCRQEIMSGSLVFCRNRAAINDLMMEVPGLASLLNQSEYLGIDETCHCNVTWQGQDKSSLPDISFTKIVDRLSNEGRIRASFMTVCKEYIYPDEVIAYENGGLHCRGKEIHYVHYVCNKTKAEFSFPGWKEVPDQFFITATGFYTAGELKLYPFIRRYRHTKALTHRAIRKIKSFL